MAEESEILFEQKGGMGIITLNRPQALNALTLGMIREMNPQLAAWAKDPAIRAVVIRGAGGRAFCSGGDVKSVALAVKENPDAPLARDFFREEYTLNHRIYSFPKPYISLIDGIVMGGGKGLSAHGSHRVVTENTLFAMPETNIGFFPDVGGGYFLPRCPGQTGIYLALTAKRIKAADTAYIGFATHFVPAEKMAALCEALFADRDVDAVLNRFAQAAEGVSEIAPHREKIDAVFSADRIEDIVLRLQKDQSPWAEETLAALRGMSPTSLKIALKQIRLGSKMPFAEVMAMEYRLSQACVRHHDFYEGIRAALIDKDRQPKWVPESVDDVPDSVIDGYFQSLGDRELVL